MTTTVEVTVDSTAPAERVLEATYDFSARRPEIWPNVAPDLYTVHDIGPDSADVTEGGRLGPLVAWERCHYDWSTTGRVIATVTDSNVYTNEESSWELRATPTPTGSRVQMIWVRGFRRNPTAKFLSLGYRLGGRRLFTPDAEKVVRNIERDEQAG